MLTLCSTRACAPVHSVARAQAQQGGRALRKVTTASKARLPAELSRRRKVIHTGERGVVVCSSSKDAAEVKTGEGEVVQLGAEQKEIDWKLLGGQLVKIAAPYWTTSGEKVGARWRLAGVFGMTLATTGISVGFNFLGRDFFNAIAEKQPDTFYHLLTVYLCAIAGGIPFFVMRDFFQQRLALRWREWMTEEYVNKYFDDRSFYRIQTDGLIDNPDQRINNDITALTATALGFTLVLFNSVIDLASFSGILLGIYPPLFGFLLLYSIGGTFLSVKFGQRLVGLNFEQETREADFRFSLVGPYIANRIAQC